jgi:hypothetical protein
MVFCLRHKFQYGGSTAKPESSFSAGGETYTPDEESNPNAEPPAESRGNSLYFLMGRQQQNEISDGDVQRCAFIFMQKCRKDFEL